MSRALAHKREMEVNNNVSAALREKKARIVLMPSKRMV